MHTLLTPLDVTTIRDLVRPSDPVASAYLGLLAACPGGDAQEDLDLRRRTVLERLAAQGADPATMTALMSGLTGTASPPGELAAFAAAGRLLLRYPVPGGSCFDRARYGAPADVVPLMHWLQRHPAYVSVMTDRTGADITAVPSGALARPTAIVVGPDDEIERNAPGGWSQPRYQQRAEDSWRHNAAAVADATVLALHEVDAGLLLVGGDVRAVQLLRDHLPPPVRRSVVLRRLPGGRGQDGSEEVRRAATATALADYVAYRTGAAISVLNRHGGPHGMAVEGVRATLAALAEGRVEALYVTDDADDERTAWFGPDLLCATGDGARRPSGEAPVRGRMVDVAVRAALLTGARVWVVDAGEFGEDVGALCRFPVA